LKSDTGIELRFNFLLVLMPRVIYQLIAKDHSVTSIMRSAQSEPVAQGEQGADRDDRTNHQPQDEPRKKPSTKRLTGLNPLLALLLAVMVAIPIAVIHTHG